MSNPKSNWPTAQILTHYDEDVNIVGANISNLYNLPRADRNDAEEVKERISQLFQYCQQAHLRPTVTLLAAALGIRRETLWKWERQGGEVGEAISRAKGIIEAHIEQLLEMGKINPAAGIFALKNHYGWKDSIEIATPTDNLAEDLPDVSEIAKRLPELDKNALIHTADLVDDLAMELEELA